MNDIQKIETDGQSAAVIYAIRGQPVVLDADLAKLFGVETKRLNEQVKRNAARFGDKYVFRLTKKEHESLRSQIAISKNNRRGCFSDTRSRTCPTDPLNGESKMLKEIEIQFLRDFHNRVRATPSPKPRRNASNGRISSSLGSIGVSSESKTALSS